MKQYKLNVTSRNEVGTSNAGRLRAAGMIPCVVYGPSGNKNLTIVASEFRVLWKKVGDATALIEISGEGIDPMWSIIQDAQRDPVTDKFVHIDFLEIARGKPMTANVPVHLTGDAVGEKIEGGFVEFQMHEVQIRCLPRNLPEFITADISGLHVGQGLHVSDLPEIEGVTYLTDAELTIAACIGKGGSTDDEDEAEEEEEEIVV